MKTLCCIRVILPSVFVCGLFFTAFSQKDDSATKAIPEVIEIKPRFTHGLKPVVNINPFYRLYAGAAYNIVQKSDEEKLYAAKHTFGLNYAVLDNSFHPYYKAHFPQLINQWNLSVIAGYDQTRRLNFYGLGNESIRSDNRDFDLVRTHHQYAGAGIDRKFSNHHIDFSVFYNAIQVKREMNRLMLKSIPAPDPAIYGWEYYVGPRLTYTFTQLNDAALPTKGVEFSTAASYSKNLERSGHSFSRYTGNADFYIPLTGKFSFVTSWGAATVTGQPDFYQLNTLGGTGTLRGFQRNRFYGKTAVYNQNELRWISETDKKFIKGKFGFMVLLDQGRVWQPGERSNKLHFGYGGGFILTLMNKYIITPAYVFSSDNDRRLHFRLRKLL